MATKNKKLFLGILLVGMAATFVLGLTNRSFSEWVLTAGKWGSTDDTNPPTATITNPTDGSMVAKGLTITISAEAYDDVGIAKVSFYVDGKRKCVSATPSNNSSYTCSWRVPGASGKTYQLQAIALDTASNAGPSPIVTVTTQ